MANTRETMGDDAALSALLGNTLTEIEDDGLDTLGSYALYKRTKLEKATFASLKTINNNAFDGCTNLKALILSGDNVPSLNSSALNNTAIYNDEGAIYVPSTMLDTYKANSSWGPYFIFSIDSYPVTSFTKEITDTWAQIKAAENDGTYTTKYSIGDTKTFTINGIEYPARIVAFDADTLSDSSGTAKITWLMDTQYSETHRMNATNDTTGGWPATEMRTWINDTLVPLIDSEVKAQAVEVTKVYKDYTNGDQTSNDTFWIPSYREVFGGTSYEKTGVVYSGWLTRASRRIRKRSGSAGGWWLRSALSATYFCYVYSSGSNSNDAASITYGVVLGFCT